MSEIIRDPKVDIWFENLNHWQSELALLRDTVLAFPFTEALKWGKPCYLFQYANVVILYSFKDCSAIGFFKGSILSDPSGLLQKPGENSQAMRMAKFTDTTQIKQSLPTLKALIQAAIDPEKAGLSVEFQKPDATPYPPELQQKLDELPLLQSAFEALTPGRQRAYLLYFSQPKQSKTRIARIEKCVAQILAGKGLTDAP